MHHYSSSEQAPFRGQTQQETPIITLEISSRIVFVVSFFFFQVEDGIRALIVTGVQTCALPIYPRIQCQSVLPGTETEVVDDATREQRGDRSEERRVGKECRSRWSPEH